MQQAVQDLAKSGEAGVATFSSQNATSVWKDSYTFVLSCEGETAVTVANPVRRSHGQAHGTDPHLRPEIGQIALISVRRTPAARGWVEYNLPKPGRPRRAQGELPTGAQGSPT